MWHDIIISVLCKFFVLLKICSFFQVGKGDKFMQASNKKLRPFLKQCRNSGASTIAPLLISLIKIHFVPAAVNFQRNLIPTQIEPHQKRFRWYIWHHRYMKIHKHPVLLLWLIFIKFSELREALIFSWKHADEYLSKDKCTTKWLATNLLQI